VVATDYDGDGWTDLFVANDSNPNFLYHNDGKGKFESVALLAGVAVNAEGRAQAGMGADAGDYDGDGDLDLVLTTFANDTVTMYRNLGGGQFEDASQAAGVAARTYVPMEWGVGFLDADLDGDLDLFLAEGHIYPQVDEHPELEETYRQKNQFLLNEDGRYRDVSALAGPGMQEMQSSRGLAIGDLDDDGRIDVVVSAIGEPPEILYNVSAGAGHWIDLQLEGATSNRDGIGAAVRLTGESGRVQYNHATTAVGYASASDKRVHFGLGADRIAAEIRIRWPSGIEQILRGVSADQVLKVKP